MATLKEIKNHIKSVSDTQKITSAMYLISSTKLKSVKSQFQALVPYFNALEEEMKRISAGISPEDCHWLREKNAPPALLVIASDKGLCGEFNKNIIREAHAFMNENPDCRVFIIGEEIKKHFRFLKRNFEEDFDFALKNPDSDFAAKVSDYLMKLFEKGEIGTLTVIYTDISDLIHASVRRKQILPIVPGTGEKKEEYEFVPSREEVLSSLIPIYLNSVFHNAIIQSYYSEQNSRMLAMDNANNNAKDMLSDLTLQYNHQRQAAITREITEIASERKRK